jgi:transglutaminase-like putative cysteine protease
MEQTDKRSAFAIKAITYVIVLWGYSALVSTGALNPYLVVAVYALIGLSWLCSVLRFDLSRGSWHLITALILFITVGYGYYYILKGLIYFLIYLVLHKLFQPQRIRDVIQLFTLSFFFLAASAILSDSMNLGIIFLGYAFLIVTGLILITIERDAQLAKREADECAQRVAEIPVRRVLGGATKATARQAPGAILTIGFLPKVAGITAAIVLVSSFLFLFIPRYSIQKLLIGLLRLEKARLTGFSDHIDFRTMSRLQNDPTVVMQVQPLTENDQPVRLTAIRLRGTSLDQYTGREWVRGPLAHRSEYPLENIKRYSFASTPFVNGTRIKQRVVIQPMDTDYVFAISYPISYEFPAPMEILLDEESDSIRLLAERGVPISYGATSLLEPVPRRDPDLPAENAAAEPSTASLARSSPALPEQSTMEPATTPSPERDQETAEVVPPGAGTRLRSGASTTDRRSIQLLYLQLPPDEFYSRIHDLAQKITSRAKTGFECARTIEAYLQMNYTYQIDVQSEDPKRYLEEFLFTRRSGNCDYFATAMVYMLRSLGIPARIVTGYYTNEWNDFGHYFVVRQENAHSWVEVWFDSFGWMTFDPTPAAGLARRVAPMPLLRQIFWFLDSLKFQWYRYVIDYDIRDQVNLTRWVQTQSRPWWAAAAEALNSVRNIMSKIGLQPSREVRMPVLFLLTVLIMALGVVLSLLLRDLVRSRKARKPSLGRYKGEGRVRFYNAILAKLAALGFSRRVQQTPREFAYGVVGLQPLYCDLIQVTESYYRVRYDEGTLTPDEEQTVKALLVLLG